MNRSRPMRTTLRIDADVLVAARHLARQRRMTIGAVLSELARHALAVASTNADLLEPEAFHGFRPLPRRGGALSDATVNRLRERGEY